MLKLFCPLVYFLLPPLVLISHLYLVLTPCLIVCACLLCYLLLRSIPKTFAHWLHPIVTFFSITYSNISHPAATWWNIGSRFKFNFAYSAMLIINITININPPTCFTFGGTSSCKLSETWYQSAILNWVVECMSFSFLSLHIAVTKFLRICCVNC